MQATVSQLKDYLRCPQYAEFIHHLHRVSVKTPTYFEEGSIFHEAMENKLKGRDFALTSYKSWMNASEEAQHRFLNKHRLDVPIQYYELDTEWKIIDTEVPLSGTIGQVQVIGRLDAIIYYNHKYWSLQWKTYTKDLLRLIEQVRLGWHEVAYEELAFQHGYYPWGGVILGACQKLPSYRVVDGKRHTITDEERIQTFTTHYLVRSRIEQATALGHLAAYLRRMEKDWGLSLRNYESCWGPNKDFRCPYYEVCHGGQSIDSDNFKTVEPRYKPIP
jgi:hypothetical protein